MRRVLPAGAVAVLAVVTLASCGGRVESLSVPSTPTVTLAPAAPVQTFPPGLASLREPPVAGVTTTVAPAIGPGNAALTGTVVGPAGPVGGATIEVERFVGSAEAATRVTAAPNGGWSLSGILGGVYRIRAWEPPSLYMDTPQLLFLSANQQNSLTLQLQRVGSAQVTAAINPSLPEEGQTESLVVQVTAPTVNADGLLTNPGVPGQTVTLVDGPAWEVSNGNPQVTDGSGRALFYVVCVTAGADPLSAQVGPATPVGLELPDCASPAPVVTVPPQSTTTSPAVTTTTSCPGQNSVPPETSTTLFGGPVGPTTTAPQGCPQG